MMSKERAIARRVSGQSPPRQSAPEKSPPKKSTPWEKALQTNAPWQLPPDKSPCIVGLPQGCHNRMELTSLGRQFLHIASASALYGLAGCLANFPYQIQGFQGRFQQNFVTFQGFQAKFFTIFRVLECTAYPVVGLHYGLNQTFWCHWLWNKTNINLPNSLHHGWRKIA